MKLGTNELVKFKRLVRRLKLEEWGAAGILEMMWNFCCRNAQDGIIGRFTNEEIATAIGWRGDENELVNALVECRWLDESAEHRLVVHDWDEHCPTWIKGNNARRKAKTVKAEDAQQNETQTAPTEEHTQLDTEEHTQYGTQYDTEKGIRRVSDPTTIPIHSNSHDTNSFHSNPSGGATKTSVRLEPMNFDPWLQAFLAMWEATPGVATCGGDVSEVQRRLIEERLDDPWFRKNWRPALEKFPLKFFRAKRSPVGISKFFEAGFAEKVLEGKYDVEWESGNGRTGQSGGAAKPASRSYDSTGSIEALAARITDADAG